jgi:hypothetical protein
MISAACFQRVDYSFRSLHRVLANMVERGIHITGNFAVDAPIVDWEIAEHQHRNGE